MIQAQLLNCDLKVCMTFHPLHKLLYIHSLDIFLFQVKCSRALWHKWLIRQSHGSNSMHLVIYTWSRRLAEVQHDHWDGEERELKWLWMWWTLWLVVDGMWVFYKLLLISWVFHHITTVSRVHREQSPKEKISSEPLLYSTGIDVLLK